MSTSVDEIVEFHEVQAARARLVASRYPEAYADLVKWASD